LPFQNQQSHDTLWLRRWENLFLWWTCVRCYFLTRVIWTTLSMSKLYRHSHPVLMTFHHRLLLPLAFGLCISASLTTTCYSIQGQPLGPNYLPCNTTTQYSACCNILDLCTSNGLCLATKSGYQGFLYANGCTDSTGRADECPHACGNGM
jgi:hypothetical protein